MRLRSVVPTLVATFVMYESSPARQIFTDGRKLPADPTPSWMGYSVAHWEGTRSASRPPDATSGRGSTSRGIRTVTGFILTMVEGDIPAKKR